ncbi:sugar isomerase domain-containing protein [Actinobacteria bacterium YIM 96077]|uniref:Sugar isomerase n=1 Tax=Phytoactinopolyspora halophila TaxID=1981511 RepID=A0A329QZM3_9ACTN|nr:sugar isomerase domain-containing protein [Actinobacteria bacterium YIM 96077]RAW17677.1 sugar isomerase [Phytoactinopolyspora halophila]
MTSGQGEQADGEPTPPVSADAFLARAHDAIDRVAATQRGNIAEAADIVADAIRRGGVVQAFGTGHSQAIAMEIAGRAGGLIPTNRIALRDLVIENGESPTMLADPRVERDPGLAQRLYDATPVDPADVFIIASNSGINGSIVGLAELAKERGHPLIAITSLEHSEQVESRHPSGDKLGEIADVVLDNAGPFGDAVLPLPGGGAVCAVSTITSALLAQFLTAEVVRRLLDAGETPPVYLSSNVPEGDAHNDALLKRYEGRIRRGGG